MSDTLPPRKKDWTPGTYQLGFFVRTPTGAVIETSWKDAPKAVALQALALLVPGCEKVGEALAKKESEAARG